MTQNSALSLWPLLAPQKGKIIISCILSVMATALGLVPFVLVYLSAIALLNPPVDQGYVWELVVISFAIIIGRWILLGIAEIVSHIAAYNILYNLRIQLAEKFAALPLGYFNFRSTGTLKKIMNEDVEFLEITIAHGIAASIGQLTTLLVTSIYLFTVDWRMTLASLSSIPLAMLSQALLFKDLQPLMAKYYAAQDSVNSTIIEYVQGMSVIKAFTQTTASFAKYQNSVRDYHEFEEDIANKMLLPFTLFKMSVNANLLFILPLGLWFIYNGSLSVPKFILFLLLGFGLCAPLVKLVESSDTYLRTQEGLKRIYSILDATALPEPAETALNENLNIEFQNVHFAYQEREIIKGVSFTIPQNSITALVGPSGSGKTTIARLIGRFWDIEAGEIRLGNVNIKNLKIADLMSKIAFVFQDVVLFNDTIYENIRMGNPGASEADIIAAAKAAQCHDFIAAMPNGYHTIIGEKGSGLSGGQKQRISIARAILKDAPIVILDEATAFIDPENEAQIQAAINQLVRNKTLILIAHRLSTITEADQILVINQGEVVAQGRHENLLQDSDLYRQLWEAHMNSQGWVFDGEQSVAFTN